jgi:xylulokinase
MYILSYDFGTTGLKSCLFNDKLELIKSEYAAYSTFYPEKNQALQRPEDWWKSICDSTKSIIKSTGIPISRISCICTDGHMNGCIPIDSSGNLLTREVMIWPDFRAIKEAAIIEKLIGFKDFYILTGSGLDLPIYPAAKIMWIKSNRPEIYKKTYKFIATKDYINYKLTKVICTDFSDASNFGLMDIRKKTWSDKLTSTLGIDVHKLPEIRKSVDIAGNLSVEAADAMGLVEGIPVIVGGGDVPCASVGAGAYCLGRKYISMGSASWLSQTVDWEHLNFSVECRPFNLCHVVDNLYASQLVNYGGAICYQWITDILKSFAFADSNYVKDIYVWVEDELEKSFKNNPGNLLFLPYIRGGGPPGYNQNVRGAFIGLSIDHSALDLVQAVMEGVAFNLKRMFPLIIDENLDSSNISIGLHEIKNSVGSF